MEFPKIPNFRFLPYMHVLEFLGIYFAREVIARESVCQSVFRCMTGSAPDYLTSKLLNDLTSVGEKLETHNRYMYIPLFKSASCQRSFYYTTGKIWNSMDNELKLSKDV